MRIVRNIGVILVLLVNVAYAQSTTDYLILQDIGDYKFKTQTKDFITSQTRTVLGYSTRTAPGFLAGVDHFDVDHDDITYETKYVNRTIGLGVEVQVTQHTGSDSDQWLMHEVEGLYRNNPDTDKYKGVLRVINGNKIFTYVRGTQYSWLSNNIVVDIRYTDLQKTKPEPLEVIMAYLQKHPSTLPAMVMDNAHDVQWIKDEMSRRMWLCDKWVLQIQTPDPKLYDKLKSIVDSMTIFLNYREKYYGIASTNDKNLINGYLDKKNDTAIKAKLAEYKTWWTAHKNDAITLS